LISLLFITGCEVLTAVSTPTEVPTIASTPTQPAPTETAESTLVSSIEGIDSINEFVVYQGGYSVAVPLFNYYIEVLGGDTFISSRKFDFMVMIYGTASDEQLPEVAELLTQQAEETFASLSGITLGEISQIEFEGAPAATASYTQSPSTSGYTGEIILVRPDDTRSIFILGLAGVSADSSPWEALGKPEFDQILTDIKLIPEEELEGRFECPMSTDPSYGFTKDNPIRVGGQAWLGPSRAVAFLNNLIDAEGYYVNATREGSEMYGDTILDLYTVTTSYEKFELYVDQYSWESPLTPVGMMCLGMYPLVAPAD